MKRIKLVVAYDGTNYCGWQIQPKDKTIEGVLNEKLSSLLNEQITVIGASRTDSGVHALGNVAVFDSGTKIAGDRIARALNQRLPDDIVIQSSEEVPDDFHPRYQDTRKTYEYTIYNAAFDNPVTARHHHFVYVPLDFGRMREASQYFLGEHDFISFSTTGSPTKTTVRTIYECEVRQDGPYITMRVTGNGFLYNMVRMMAGTLISIGRGRRGTEWITELFRNPKRGKAGPNAPAKGLTLIKIRYMDQEREVD
ncbi:tRNA pseudouridine(38-40) synthase TruA [Anaerostipes sp.]|uniref:tRNA pseudouridine(38-40) synthase TruA n=1 Tax=Anaerostipes sp. TaxID=1872530 RepID=UPI0025C0DB51|nr:tRNA pseudouridine(38-40) synthase TruA [Anaerostipes sp.]MBS7008922.1 tRNA pseudouridine(38-40) synthase TruA [Anaerostipes sp.]